ncbi:MAG: DUF1653 domain-containing protein [Patescibacteria group bacterium]|nr:DUF1653 domain-containing protein [Patescibacteria group bacterium]
MATEIKPGQIYRHFKGDLYKVITLAKHTENEELLVVYERQTDTVHSGWRVWARPESMFLEKVDKDGYKGPRFEYIGD